MKLIMNADDFGLSKGVNFGIIDAYENGLVRSTTMMAGGLAFDHAVGLHKKYPDLKIGVHLTLTSGKSLGSGYKTITDEGRNFHKLGYVEENIDKFDVKEIENEYELQINKIIDAGIKPDHFDSHHHTHNLPRVIDMTLKLARKYGVKIRIQDHNKKLLESEFNDIKTTDYYSEEFYAAGATAENLKKIILENSRGSLEIMCHPAFADFGLLSQSSYNTKRAEEHNVITSLEMQEFVKENNIEICSFMDI